MSTISAVSAPAYAPAPALQASKPPVAAAAQPAADPDHDGDHDTPGRVDVKG